MNSRVNPRNRAVKVAIVGGGFGGLCMAIKLREAGIEDFVVLEKAGELGGTWRENTYPGCACDVQSHLYSYSFEGNPDWSARYSGWREIQDYILATAGKHGIHERTRFHAEVIGAHYDEARARWTLDLTDGDQVECQHWVLASGPLHVPQIPNFPGLERFQGKVFHSSQWDHDYDLSGKKVVSVGTGASAIQYVPQIAPEVERLTVVQRTPGWIIPRDERRYSALSKRLFRRFPALRKLHRARLYWSNESRVLPIFHPRLAMLLEKGVKQFIRLQVKDKDTARRLTPSYTLGCKRIMISNRYYPTFNRDNVELVTEGVKEVREHSIVFSDGSEREMDCLVLGTGFVVDPRIYMQGFPIVGRGGRTLQEDWKEASEAYLGITVAGYPNLFQMVGPNTGLGHNSIVFMIECQARYIVDAIEKADAKGVDALDVKRSEMDAFNEKLQKDVAGTVWQQGGCSSWYQQADGKNVAIWPYSTWRYWLKTRQVDDGKYHWEKAARPVTPTAAIPTNT
ncbi:flavin-containing monooxygenase [Alloalcanivorax profundimaris]|uniref:flavin-containing monooxygenase n=1 Tax=Alloalcanivorax profundimaris TaxID=2735259 RepID=UPI0018886709|nr:NAD(P)/FAD-dependent oxidoreductase [Alloalcanivorax profundimaris]MBF1801942.1 NAD(P)/FAD-dependent oxidoreductase [Alloalcanivorax profundimaris]